MSEFEKGIMIYLSMKLFLDQLQCTTPIELHALRVKKTYLIWINCYYDIPSSSVWMPFSMSCFQVIENGSLSRHQS